MTATAAHVKPTITPTTLELVQRVAAVQAGRPGAPAGAWWPAVALPLEAVLAAHGEYLQRCAADGERLRPI